MASKAAAVLVSSLFVLTLFSPPHVQARESKFFSKVTRYMSPTTAEGPSSGDPEAPAPAPEPESGVDDGYGLFGRGSKEFSSTTTTGSENQVSEEELMNESYKEMEEGSNGYSNSYNQNNLYTGKKEGMSDTRFLENGKYYHPVEGSGKSKNQNQYSPSSTKNGNTNEYYQTNEYTPEQQEVYQTNEYTPEQQEVVADARYSENGYNYKNTYDANEYSTTTTTTNNNNNYNKNGYRVKQQGMSDTRFLNNGKYFHDIENEKQNNYNDVYTTEEKESNSHDVYYPNTENSGEFYNQYEGQQQEYQQQEYYQEAPMEYVP